MAKQSGLGDNFLIAGYNLSGDVSALNKISCPVNLSDVTSIEKSAHERLPLLRDAVWQFTSFFDNASGAEHPALSSLPTADVVAVYLRGTGVGNSAAGMNCKQIDYDPTRANTGELTLKVDLQADAYGMDWGIQLTDGLRTDTSATVGADYDNSLAYDYGAQAYWVLTAFEGTSVEIEINHCATSGGSYTNLMNSGSQTGIGAGRMSVSNTTTVDRYLEVTTTGTFTEATFAVLINVNPFASVSF